MHLNQFFHLML